jgi:indole-3-glycerol phosphate synthase
VYLLIKKMNILDKIIAQKHLEVAARKAEISTKMLEKSPFFDRKTHSMSFFLKNSPTGIIAEIKRKSPSKGIINDKIVVADLAKNYVAAGASVLSILTDELFFGGTMDDLKSARPMVENPILRKDFIIDEYQILEAKAIGADAILLLANVHNPLKIRELARFARSLELEILLELHDEDELSAICPEVNCVGVNNRNLKNFEVSLEHSFRLGALISDDFLRVAESGLTSAAEILSLREVGFRGFLMGEFFMKNERPDLVLRDLVAEMFPEAPLRA